MKWKVGIIGAFLTIFPLSVLGQTTEELKDKYGTPIEAYLVRPNVFMTVKYGDDGQVSEMVLEKRHTTNSGINLDPYFSEEQIKELIDELAPIHKRGERTDINPLRGNYSGYLDTLVSGRITITEQIYEHVIINVTGSFSGKMVIIIKWKL